MNVEIALQFIIGFLLIGAACSSFWLKYPGNVIILLFSCFGFGYYVIPFFMPMESGYVEIEKSKVNYVLIIHLIFIFGFIAGIFISNNFPIYHRKKKTLTPNSDSFLLKYKDYLYWIGVLLYLIINSGSRTSYESEDRMDFFTGDKSFAARLVIFSPFILAYLSSVILFIYNTGNKKKSFIFLSGYFGIVLFCLTAGQRLYAITPMIYIFIYAAKNIGFRKSILVLCATIALLVVISPVAVFFRESWANVNAENKSITESFSTYLEEGRKKSTGPLQTLGERADLYYVTYCMLPVIAKEDFGYYTYLKSAVYSFLPKELRPEKLYPLSDDGSIYGETSVMAWFSNHSNQSAVGSLTAFGGLNAYREGGMLWVFFNGFICAFLAVNLTYFVSNSGLLYSLFIGLIVSLLTVKLVPASLFQFIVALGQPILIFCCCAILEVFLAQYTGIKRKNKFY
jgi:O-antigen polysaccharide polymerase Wzy